METIVDLDLTIPNPTRTAADRIWRKLRIIADAYVQDGHTVTLTETTYTDNDTGDDE